MTDEIKVYTVEEVADILQVTRRTVYTYIKEGKINATKIGKYWRITNKDLEALFTRDNK